MTPIDVLPEELDVLIVGAGPAGHLAAAQLAQFPQVTTRLIERAPGRLELGRADGVQARTVETFQAFGFANRIIDEAYRITATAFWGPDPAAPERLVRTSLHADDPGGLSEFPHIVISQARVHDHFVEAMAAAPAPMAPVYGIELLDLDVLGDGVAATVRDGGAVRTVRAQYVLGTDGARSRVRECIGGTLRGEQAMHAWGVMDVLGVTDFPDIRLKCAIRSPGGGAILSIPREGGHLVRMYVDLGDVDEDDPGAVRRTTLDEIIARARAILHPYALDVRSIPWWSVYEVGHRLADRFDDVPAEQVGRRTPRVFIAGDACHTHSAKAAQGMNVSMQDAFNIAWKLGHVLTGRAPATILDTYSVERHRVAQHLIDFDRQWSTLMAADPEELDDAGAVSEFFVQTFEFTTGFMTQYAPSLLTAAPTHQALATGFPIGQRFHSAEVIRVADANPVHLGHHARADGRWRIYVFADADASRLARFATGIVEDPEWFDLKVIYQQRFDTIDLDDVPRAFLPRSGPLDLVDYERVYAAGPGPDGRGADIFDVRGIDRGGVVVVVRPDQYVASVLPLTGTEALAAFFDPILLR